MVARAVPCTCRIRKDTRHRIRSCCWSRDLEVRRSIPRLREVPLIQRLIKRILLAVFLLVFIAPAKAESVIVPVPVAEAKPLSAREIATREAIKHGLMVDRFLKVIECESQWNTKAVGDHGTSYGLAQLHNPVSDWGVTKEEAMDPEVALPIMAEAWGRGEHTRWSCWWLHYGQK